MSFPLDEFIKKAKGQGKSSAYIEATTSYAKNLIAHNYPVIFSLENLAILMRVQSGYLRFLIGEGDDYYNPYKYKRYNYFKLKKKRGGYREIMTPCKDLKFIQKWILVNILEKKELPNSCKGFRKKHSIKDNALAHQNADVILKIDLLKFYDTITLEQVTRVFVKMGYIKNLAISLAKITTARHRKQYWDNIKDEELLLMGHDRYKTPSILPQGAPTSPALANIIASDMDLKFEKLSSKLGFSYTRYADDLTFSIKKGTGILPKIGVIKKIISSEGFCINEEKTNYYKKGQKQYITGLTISNGVNISKSYRKEIASHIFFCKKFGIENHLEKKREKEKKPINPMVFHDWLYGHICFISSINEEAGKKLLNDFKKIDWFSSLTVTREL